MMKKLLVLLLMAVSANSMIAQETIVDFNAPVPMPKEMKGKDWQVLSCNNDELIIYAFKGGNLSLASLDLNGNVKQQVSHKDTRPTLMKVFANEQEVAVLTYDANIGGIQCNTYDAKTLAPKDKKTLAEQRKDVFDSYHLSVSKNGQYIGLLTNYIKKAYQHKLYLFDRDFNVLTTSDVLADPELKNLASVLEADMEVTDDGKAVISSFRTILNRARRYDGDKSKLNFGKATYATADYAVEVGVDIISKDGQQHYDINSPVSGLVMRPNILSINDDHLLIGMFVGHAHGMFASPFALTDDYVTLDCDLTAKTAVEKGSIALPGAPWSCLLMYNNKLLRMSHAVKMADGSHVIPADKNPRDPYNRFEINFNREFIWADADGSNLTFGSWGSMTVNKQPLVLGGVSTDGGMSVRFPYADRYWLVDIPDTEMGTGTLRSCTKDGKMTQTTPDGFRNITVNSHFISQGGGKFLVLNIGKQNKEDVIQTGTVEMK